MKKGFNILLALVVFSMILSCNKNKSYAEMLKDERKAIERFLDDNEFTVINDYPADGVFKEGEFVLLDNGIYLNIVDSGNGNRAASGQTILCRFIANYLISGDYANYIQGGSSPLEFKYGLYYSSGAEDEGRRRYLADGVPTILEYVGDSAVVNLIIPFKHGSYYSNYYADPIYYENLRYIFDK